jgi:hypothetical protein
LFPLLFEAEKRIDVSEYNIYQKRVLAFLAERLLNVYVYHHKLKIIYESVYFIVDKRNVVIKRKIKNIIRNVIKFIIPYGLMEWWHKRKYIESKKNGT